MTTGAPVAGFTADTDARVHRGRGHQHHRLRRRPVHHGQRRRPGVPRGRRRHHRRGRHRLRQQHHRRHRRQRRPRRPAAGAHPRQQKLLVVHTGRQVAGQDRYGVALIDTATKQLLPWHTRLWEDNLQFVGGIQRIYGAAIAPDDSYFVVTSGSGGDRPPINDTADRLPASSGGDDVAAAVDLARVRQRLLGGDLREGRLHRRPLRVERVADRPRPVARPGRHRLRHRPGPLGVRARRRRWSPASTSAPSTRPTARRWSGTPARTPTRATRRWWPRPRGLITGGDATTQGGEQRRPRRVLRLQQRPCAATASRPPSPSRSWAGCVDSGAASSTVKGTASAAGGVDRVEVEIQNRDNGQYLQDNLTTWGGSNTDQRDPRAARAPTSTTGRCRSPWPATSSCWPRPAPSPPTAPPDPITGDQEVRDVQPRRRAAHGELLRARRGTVRPRRSPSPAPPPTTRAWSR